MNRVRPKRPTNSKFEHENIFKLVSHNVNLLADIDGLKRKLVRKLSVNEEGSGLDWEV